MDKAIETTVIKCLCFLNELLSAIDEIDVPPMLAAKTLIELDLIRSRLAAISEPILARHESAGVEF